MPTKTRASGRRIVLPARCRQSFRRHQEEQQHRRDIAGTTGNTAGTCSLHRRVRVIDPTNVTRTPAQGPARPHPFPDLRHPIATMLLERGVELIVIKELLGHANIGVTDTICAHVRPRLERDSTDILGRALRNPAAAPDQPDDGDLPIALRSLRPLTSSTTAVTTCRAPVGTHPAGAQVCARDLQLKSFMFACARCERVQCLHRASCL